MSFGIFNSGLKILCISPGSYLYTLLHGANSRMELLHSNVFKIFNLYDSSKPLL